MSGASPSGRAAGLRPQPPAASSQSSIPDASVFPVTKSMLDAWVTYDGPTPVDGAGFAKQLGAMRHAFYAGYRAALIAPQNQNKTGGGA